MFSILLVLAGIFLWGFGKVAAGIRTAVDTITDPEKIAAVGEKFGVAIDNTKQLYHVIRGRQ